MLTSTLVEYVVSGGAARVTMNRPEKRNALNRELVTALHEALDRAAADEAVTVILLRGAGKDFCAGLDLASLSTGADASSMDYVADARPLADLFLAMRRNPKPIVAAVHGRALAGGCGIATASDLIVASESAEFRYSEINIGFVPAMVLAMLRRSVSEKLAFELAACGDPVTATEAERIGLINRVWPDSVFADRTEEYVVALAGKAATALALTKKQLYQIDALSFETAIESGVTMNALARGTAAAKQGIEQFTSRKK